MHSDQIIAGSLIAIAGTAILHDTLRNDSAAERLAAAALETLLHAIDANDPQTGAHVRRVAAYSRVIAQAADLDDYSQWLAEQVALFHDIGKIHEAFFDIIHEASTLTRAERRALALHPQRGAEVLEPLSAFYPQLSKGVIAHHERWNGRGYPRGLKGARIPLSARIVAIADTFDAVTYRRRYSEGRSPQRALEIILNGRGTEFDPELVDLFALPPVYDEIVKTHDVVARWQSPVSQRRRGREDENVRPITFRWRPSQRTARLLKTS